VPDRVIRGVWLALLVLAVLFVGRPYIERLMLGATAPRPVEARGNLSDVERTNIGIFERAAPSVIRVAGSAANGRIGAGTGFIWDVAGHAVTNNHVVEGAQSLQVRLASGEVLQADIVGTAPNYDLAVIRIRSGARLPPPLAVGTSADLRVGQFTYAIGNPFGLACHSPRAWSARSSDGRRRAEDAKLTASYRPMRRSTPAIPLGHCSIPPGA
jgi:2-alkenal reductase